MKMCPVGGRGDFVLSIKNAYLELKSCNMLLTNQSFFDVISLACAGGVTVSRKKQMNQSFIATLSYSTLLI